MSNPYLPARRTLGGLPVSREDRLLVRHQRSLWASTSLELSEVQAAEIVSMAKIQAFANTGHAGMAAAAGLAADRRSCVERDPTALAEVCQVVDPAVRAIAGEIEALRRRLS